MKATASVSGAAGVNESVLSAGDFVQAGDMRQALWKVVDAVHVAGKVACTVEYERVRCLAWLQDSE